MSRLAVIFCRRIWQGRVGGVLEEERKGCTPKTGVQSRPALLAFPLGRDTPYPAFELLKARQKHPDRLSSKTHGYSRINPKRSIRDESGASTVPISKESRETATIRMRVRRRSGARSRFAWSTLNLVLVEPVFRVVVHVEARDAAKASGSTSRGFGPRVQHPRQADIEQDALVLRAACFMDDVLPSLSFSSWLIAVRFPFLLHDGLVTRRLGDLDG